MIAQTINTSRASDKLAIIKSNSAFTLWAADAQAVSAGYSFELFTELRNYGVSSVAEDALQLWEGTSHFAHDHLDYEAEPRTTSIKLFESLFSSPLYDRGNDPDPTIEEAIEEAFQAGQNGRPIEELEIDEIWQPQAAKRIRDAYAMGAFDNATSTFA